MRRDFVQLSDVILLPYDPIVYRSGTSGIFVEAIFGNKLVLTKEGTWIAHELKKFNIHELIVDWENPYFFENLRMLIESKKVQRKLTNMHQAYLEFHNVDTFSSLLKKYLTA